MSGSMISARPLPCARASLRLSARCVDCVSVASQGKATRAGNGVPVRADGTKRSGVGAGRGAEAEERDGWGDRCRDITKEIHLSPPLFASGGSQGSFSKYI